MQHKAHNLPILRFMDVIQEEAKFKVKNEEEESITTWTEL